MRRIDDYAIEVLISLALVTATYAIAQRPHVSGPLAVVAAGLLIGHRGPQDAMSDQTKSYVFGLWALIDEIPNSILFLLIGLEVLLLSFTPNALVIAAAAIPIVLAARLIAVGLPALVSWSSQMMGFRNVPFLAWGRHPGRHFRGARSIRARQPCPAGDSGGNLRGRPFQHHHPRIDARLCCQTDGVAKGRRRSQKLLTADQLGFCDDAIAVR